jgi:hypothetical protein
VSGQAYTAAQIEVGRGNVFAAVSETIYAQRKEVLKSRSSPWSEPSTKKQIANNIRVLKHVILKTTANAGPFLGASSRTLSMVFALKKLPSHKKALRILLPHPLLASHMVDGLFFKTAQGKKVLAVLFGRGDMDEATLVENAWALTDAVSKLLEIRLVSEVTVEAEKLKLPLWWDKGKKKSIPSWSHCNSKRGSMAPPRQPPLKKTKICDMSSMPARSEFQIAKATCVVAVP